MQSCCWFKFVYKFLNQFDFFLNLTDIFNIQTQEKFET